MARTRTSSVGKIVLKMWFVTLLATCIPASARLVDMTLPEVVAKSSVIVYGHTLNDAKHPPNTVMFEPIRFIKGAGDVNGKAFLVCQQEVFAENFDLSKITDNYVLLASREGNCFSPVYYMASTILVVNNQAQAGVIMGEPERQPLEEFLSKILKLVGNK
jgi:hypothetical protein